MSEPGFVIEEFTSVIRNTLRGFARVRTPSGILLIEVAIHEKDGHAWALPASKPMLSRDGTVMHDAANKIQYARVVGFASRQFGSVQRSGGRRDARSLPGGARMIPAEVASIRDKLGTATSAPSLSTVPIILTERAPAKLPLATTGQNWRATIRPIASVIGPSRTR